ncbi:MAG: entericidin A/B family lipoprotein [Sedimentisphaeraceae bacterium JB056]
MRKFKMFILCSVLLAAIAVFVSGCNTIEGMGEDIESGGERIQEAAE